MFGNFFKKPKIFRAAFDPLKEEIEISRNETILSSGLNNGLALPHSCRVGSCGTCRCRLVEGKVHALTDPTYILSAEELRDGYILTCQSQPRSDLKLIYDHYDPDAAVISATMVRGEIIQTRLLTHDINEVTVLIDARVQYHAGQYAEVYAPAVDVKRSYSFASAPAPGGNRELCFHIRHVPGGVMTQWLHGSDRTGEEVRLTAPYGTFWLRSSDAPILCIAGGSGMAPIKAVLEQAAARGCARPVRYYFGARTQADLYCLEEMQQLKEKWPGNFDFIPVLSDEPGTSNWKGARGLVTQAVEESGLNVADHEAYLCGPPGMIDAAMAVLRAGGMPESSIHFDKFLDASHGTSSDTTSSHGTSRSSLDKSQRIT
jgi:NAD(P)H-flavin reductase/ferredoxin